MIVSRPRQVLPGHSYLITRRCTQRMMLMRPDARTNQSFVYCLAVAAEKYDIDVLFTVAMSNHHHTGIHDQHGNFPAFLEHFHKLFAKCQNAHRGRWENFWASEQTSAVRLVDAEDILSKLVYSACNPVEAALVERAGQWPGISSYKSLVAGTGLTAKRPEHFFRRNGAMPESASLEFRRPPGWEHLDQARWAELIRDRVVQREKELRRKRAKVGKRVLGIEKVLRQRWSSRPTSKEPRRRINPRIACRNKWRRIEALLQDREFLRAYRAAREAMNAGLASVFPPGTYWLCRFTDAVCPQTAPS